MTELTSEMAQEREKLYARLKNYKKVAKKLNIDKALVKNHIASKMQSRNNQNVAIPQNQSDNKLAVAAYKYYSNSKSPLDVAIELGISADKAIRYQEEYWRLSGAYHLDYIRRIQPDFWEYLELFERMRILKLKPDQFVGYLGNLDDLKKLEETLTAEKKVFNGILEEKEKLEREITDKKELIKQQDAGLTQIKAEYSSLLDETKKLETKKRVLTDFIRKFTSSNSLSEMQNLTHDQLSDDLHTPR